MAEGQLADLVQIACHDLRTPLATITGLAKTMARSSDLGERDARFVEMMDEAATQLTRLVAKLSLANALAAGRRELSFTEADTLELAGATGDERIAVTGHGELIETDRAMVEEALAGLAVAALRHGQLERVTWHVDGRALALSPIEPLAAPVVEGSLPKDLGALVAGLVLTSLGASTALDGNTFRVRL